MSNTSQRTALIIGSIVIIALGAILILSSVAGPTGPAAAPPAAVPTAAPPASSVADIPYPEIKRVSPGDARAALELKQAVIVDVRDADSYASKHIAGAINIPLSELEARLKELDPNQWIITYCT
jgi:hypothetical protein